MMPALHDHPAGHPREDECQFNAIRAQGAGGQNINKVSNAVHLRYDIHASSLPEGLKERLLALGDQRIRIGAWNKRVGIAWHRILSVSLSGHQNAALSPRTRPLRPRLRIRPWLLTAL